MAAFEQEGLLPGGPPPAPRSSGGRSWRRRVVGVAACILVVYFAASSRAVQGGRAALVEDIAQGLPDENDPSEQAAMIMGSVNPGGDTHREAIPLARKNMLTTKIAPQLFTPSHLPPPRMRLAKHRAPPGARRVGVTSQLSPSHPMGL
jgi:hypothetical protein